MAEYPEHEKVSVVKAESQAIGEFLDFGLPKMDLTLYQRATRPCDCKWCKRGASRRSAWHTAEEQETIIDGVVQVTEWRPTHRTIPAILAEYFDIDQGKLDDEKEAMLDALRARA